MLYVISLIKSNETFKYNIIDSYGMSKMTLWENELITLYQNNSVGNIEIENGKVRFKGGSRDRYTVYNLNGIRISKTLGIVILDRYLDTYKVAFPNNAVKIFTAKQLIKLIESRDNYILSNAKIVKRGDTKYISAISSKSNIRAREPQKKQIHNKSYFLLERIKRKKSYWDEMSHKAEARIAKLRMIGQYENYIIQKDEDILLIQPILPLESGILYIPKEVNIVDDNIWIEVNEPITVIGPGKLKTLSIDDEADGITDLIVACDTSNLVDISYDLVGLHNLRRFVLIGNGSKLTNINNAFYECEGLREVYMFNVDTSSMTRMVDTFNGCINLSYVDIACFNTINVETYSSLFDSCTHLKYVDLRNWALNPKAETRNMFSNSGILDTNNEDFNNILYRLI